MACRWKVGGAFILTLFQVGAIQEVSYVIGRDLHLKINKIGVEKRGQCFYSTQFFIHIRCLCKKMFYLFISFIHFSVIFI